MKIKKTICSTVAVALSAQAIVAGSLPSVAQASARTVAAAEQVTAQLGEVAGLKGAQDLNLNLLIAATMVEQKFGGLIPVSEQIANRYNKMKSSYLGTVPTIIAGSAATFLGNESSKRVEFLLKPLTALLRASGRAITFSGEQVEIFSRSTGLDKVLEKSSNVATWSVEEIIIPIAKLFLRGNLKIASGAVSASAVFAGSVTFMTNNSNEIMTWASARSLLGQDKAMNNRVDALVHDMSTIFNLTPSDAAKLKLAIYDEALRQAISHKFSEDPSKYSLDVIEVMSSQKLITADAAKAIGKLREVTTSMSASQDTAATIAIIRDNVDSAIDLAALLAQQLATNTALKSDKQLVKELERMLGSLVAKLSLIGFNVDLKNQN